MATYNSYYTFIPVFEKEDIGIEFGGFIVDKFINSQPGAKYEKGNPVLTTSPLSSENSNVPSISKSGVPVWDDISFADAMIVCANRGKGWHLMTPYEQAALAYLTKDYNIQPSGNNSGGDNPPSNYDDNSEVGIYDGEVNGRSLTGTGSLKWVANKIFDLNGVAREWVMMLMASNKHDNPGELYIPANENLKYLESPFGRGVYRENDEENFERVYLSSSDLSPLSVGNSVRSDDSEASGYIVAIDDDNDYVYVRLTEGSFEDKSELIDTTAGETLTIDDSAGTGSTGIDGLVSIKCDNSSSTVWDKKWETNEFEEKYLYIAESTDSGEMVDIIANTENEIIFDPTTNMNDNFTNLKKSTFCIFRTIGASNITDNFSSSTWYTIESLYTDSDLGPYAVISESTDSATIYSGKQYFNYDSDPIGTSSAKYIGCETGGAYNDEDKSGVFMKVFEASLDHHRTETSFRACKII
ncbi:MAG: hypothetical protein ACOC22_02435 [bacterium]